MEKWKLELKILKILNFVFYQLYTSSRPRVWNEWYDEDRDSNSESSDPEYDEGEEEVEEGEEES